MENSTLKLALEFASFAHANQSDKAGKPYIEHVKRVSSHLTDDNLKVIAYLHDVIEDTNFTAEDIQEKFGHEISIDVQALTKREGETYADFIKRIAVNPRARKVKMADLQDNLDLSRLPTVSRLDFERAEKYKMALAFLELVDGMVHSES
jgi:(p)ppGpp synthase/HD superfamily hydrolase